VTPLRRETDTVTLSKNTHTEVADMTLESERSFSRRRNEWSDKAAPTFLARTAATGSARWRSVERPIAVTDRHERRLGVSGARS